MLIAVCSDKGSPGATTAALVLAASWPERVAVVEADPRGGDLASRLPLEAIPPSAKTVIDLGTEARKDSDNPDLVLDHAIGLTDRLGLVPGFRIAEEAADLGGMWYPLADALWCSDLDVIADLGHLHTDSPAIPIAAVADIILVVGRPTVPSITQLPERLTRLAKTLADERGRPAVFWPVLIGPRRRAGENAGRLVAMLAGSVVKPAGIGHLTDDTSAASRLVDGQLASKKLSRTPLMRSSDLLVSRLHPAARKSSDEPTPVWPPARSLKRPTMQRRH